MKVAIAGGHGKIALRLERLLHEGGDQALALISNPAHEADVREAGGEAVICDLEDASAEDAAAAISGCDAVVFAAGAGPGSAPERKETVDYGAAVKLIEACRAAGISRYVIVSSRGADSAAEGEGFALYLRAKGRADDALRESGLDWTVVRPVALTDDPGTGSVEVGDPDAPEITRDDVAAVLAACLRTPSTIGKSFRVSEGDTPIDDAVAAL